MYGEHQLLPVPTHAPNLQNYSTNLSRGTKIRIYKNTTQPVLMYGSELGTLSAKRDHTQQAYVSKEHFLPIFYSITKLYFYKKKIKTTFSVSLTG